MRYIWIIFAVFLVSGSSSAQQSKRQTQAVAQIKKYKSADPSADLERAWTKGDLRFIGVYGLALETPGILFGSDKGFIGLFGVNPVQGTTDAITFSEQFEFNGVASQYAKKYNLKLFQKIQASRNTNPILIRLFGQTEQEIKYLEQANSKVDLRRNIQKKDFRFICLYGADLEGVHKAKFDELKPYQLQRRELNSNKDLVTREQYRRFQRIAITYVRPYNQMLFKYLKNRAKKK